MIFDTRRCELGEGIFWHPDRGQIFWFDILGRRLMTVEDGTPRAWDMPELTSAAAVLSRDELLLATETAFVRFNLVTGARTPEAALDADDAGTRSNDGRADRQGGFWVGTMGKRGPADVGRGAIWRFYKGEVRRLFGDLTIPNAITFSVDGRTAHFADTVRQKVFRVALDAEGWPVGAPSVYLDLADQGLYPDGAVIDAGGLFWNAQWGAGRVAAYDPEGRFVRAVTVEGASQTSCPAFGGADLSTLYLTTAMEGMDEATRTAEPNAGKTFAVAHVGRGLPEPKVIL